MNESAISYPKKPEPSALNQRNKRPHKNTNQTKNTDQDDNLSDYFCLLKPKVMTLVVFTGFAGMWVAPGFNTMHPILAFVAILSLAIGAGASGAINMWYERDLDKKMLRTQNRPIPAGRIIPEEGLAFAIILSMASIMLMGLAINWLAAGLLAFANFFYVVIYTMWLKPRTPQNIVIGGAAGAFPPMIGWAAVTGDISILSIVLFLIIFFWTPPHFWALALFASNDYEKANIPMLPVTRGEKETRIQMLIYTIILWPISLSPWLMGNTGIIYGATSIILSSLFVVSAITVLKNKTIKDAKSMFGYSIFYLFALFLALMLDGLYYH